MFLCLLGLNVKSFNLNESSISPVPLMTSPRIESTSLLSSLFFLSLRECRKSSVGVPLYWDCLMNRMLWDRRDVTGSLHYFLLRLSVFLNRNRCLIWLSDIVIYSLSWSVLLILFLLIFLFLFNRWFTSWIRSFFIVYSLVLYSCFHFLITLS